MEASVKRSHVVRTLPAGTIRYLKRGGHRGPDEAVLVYPSSRAVGEDGRRIPFRRPVPDFPNAVGLLLHRPSAPTTLAAKRRRAFVRACRRGRTQQIARTAVAYRATLDAFETYLRHLAELDEVAADRWSGGAGPGLVEEIRSLGSSS